LTLFWADFPYFGMFSSLQNQSQRTTPMVSACLAVVPFPGPVN